LSTGHIKQQDDKQIVYELEELEAIYNIYYGNGGQISYFEDKSILREKKSNIPLLK
jgi:hypothetical protein